MNDVHVTVCGNLVAAPERRATASGHAKVTFRLATTPRRFDRQSATWVDGDPSYYTVIAWRSLGEGIAGALGKGDPVVVTGRLVLREWVSEDQQKRGTAHEIEADAVGPDLRRCTATVHRVNRAGAADWSAVPSQGDPLASEWTAPMATPPAV